jgi:predicted permease
MAAILRDLRFGCRLLARQPGSTAVVVATFALGIGLSGTMFCLVHGASRQLPFPDPSRLVHLERSIPSQGLPGVEAPIHDVLDWSARQRSLEGLAAFHTGGADLSGAGLPPERYRAAFVSAGALPLLRVEPLLGRGFQPGEDAPGAEPVALLGYAVWRGRFGGDPGVVGRPVRIDGRAVTVVGVMPEGFRFPLREDLWLPLRIDALALPRGEGRLLEVFGRLRRGVSLDQARRDLDGVARQLAAEHPETNAGVGIAIKPYVEEFVPREVRGLLWTMLGAVLGVLLVACANVANLILARALLRGQEMAVRAALGAGRGAIARQVLVEALLAAAAGLVGGLVFAGAAVALFRSAVAATDPPFWVQFRLDVPALAWSAGAALVAALLAAWVPALQAAGQDPGEVLRGAGRGGSGFRMGRAVRALVVGEIAVTLALLAAAGLMIRTISNLRALDYGFPPAEVLTARLELPAADDPTGEARRRFAAELLGRLEALPGVRGAALTSHLPVTPAGATRLAVEGRAAARPEDLPVARQVAVSPGFLATLGLAPLAGRGFGGEDREDGLAVALLDAGLAARLFPRSPGVPGKSAVGRHVRIGDGRRWEPWRAIVGVVPDLYPAGPGVRDAGGVYIPLAQSDAADLHLMLRPAGAPLASAGAVRREVRGLDPGLAVGSVATLAEVIRRETWHYGVFGTLFLVFGGAALFLAAVGLGGVMAFAIARRTHEIGVRRAMGAGTGAIGRLVLGQAGTQVAAGLALGLVLALPLARAIRFVLFGVEPWDAPTFLGIAAVLVAACFAACLLPLARAVRIDPAAALRAP